MTKDSKAKPQQTSEPPGLLGGFFAFLLKLLTRFSIPLILLAILGFAAHEYATEWVESISGKSALQAKIVRLQARYDSLENAMNQAIQKMDTRPPAAPEFDAKALEEIEHSLDKKTSSFSRHILMTFLFHQLMDAYYHGEPFKLHLKKVLALLPESERNDGDFLWLLTYGEKGVRKPSAFETLLQEDATSKKKKEVSGSFWDSPLQNMRNAFRWDNFFTVRSQKQASETATLRSLLMEQDFTGAMSLITVSQHTYPHVKQALEERLRSAVILKRIEHLILKTLAM